MSFFWPAPSMMVVFSLAMRDALGAAEHVEGHVLELDAEVFGDDLAAGEDGDVLEHGLAAIAEARSLDGGDLQAATELVDDEGRESLAFDVLGDDEQRLAGLHDSFEDRQHGLERRELLLVDEDVGVLELGHHLLGVGDEVGREVAAVELHAFDDVELGLGGLGFLDRDDAFVADLLHRLSDHLADFGVAVGRDGADLGNFIRRLHLLGAGLDVLDGFSRARSMPRFRSIGFMPAATDLAPSRTIDWARTVAVVVPSPAMSLVFEATSRTIWAPMFSNLSASSISLATVTPSLVMRGAPKDLSMTTLRPLGPSVTFTASARMSTPRSIFSRASEENFTSLAAMGFASS